MNLSLGILRLAARPLGRSLLLWGGVLLHAFPLSVAAQGDDPWLRIIIELEAEGAGAPVFHFHDMDRAPDTLRTLAAEEGGVEEGVEGVLTLAFAARPLDDILPLLRLLPQDRTEVRVVIRIPPNLRGADLWDFQARLSAERLRRVRIEFGDPPPSKEQP